MNEENAAKPVIQTATPVTPVSLGGRLLDIAQDLLDGLDALIRTSSEHAELEVRNGTLWLIKQTSKQYMYDPRPLVRR